MRDNQKIHLDELFRERFQNESDRDQIHSSWKKMEALLDGEQDKRRFVLWRGLNWLVPALLISLTGAGIGYWSYQKAEEETTMPQQTVAQNTPQAKTPTTNPSWIEDTDKKDESEQADQPSRTATQPQLDQVVQTAQTIHKQLAETPQDVPVARKSEQATAQKQNITEGLEGQVVGITDDGTIITEVRTNNNFASPSAFQKAQQSLSPELEAAALEGKLVVEKESGEIKKENLRKVRGVLVTERPYKDPATEEFVVLRDTVGYPEVDKIEYISLTSAEIRELQKVSLIRKEGNDQYDLIRINKNSFTPEEVVASKTKTVFTRKKSSSDKDKSTSVLRDINRYFQIKNNFYFTVFGGLNMSAPAVFPIGFQVSPGVHYLLGSRWSIGAELGYAYRPMSYTFTDEAVSYTQHGPGIPVASGVRFDYREEKNSNIYNFRFINTFDLPVFVSYETEKWAVFGGPSLHFVSKLRYQKLTSFEARDKSVILPDAESFDMANTTLQSSPQDFNARMGFGVLMGVKYSLTDRLGLTLRYSQVLSDQSSTNVGAIISKETFRLPSFRLGVTYRLNSDKRVKYMLGQ